MIRATCFNLDRGKKGQIVLMIKYISVFTHFPDIFFDFNLLKTNDIYISYRSANLQTLHFKYLFNKYTY